MKVQTKIVLLLAVVFSTFMAGLWAYRVWDKLKIRTIAEKGFNERNTSFAVFLKNYSERLDTLTEDYTKFDRLVQAIQAKDRAWFNDDISVARLEAFRANAAWVYGTDGTRLHHVDNLGWPEVRDVPIPREAFARMFATERRCHFFVSIRGDRDSVMEIRGGTVHPSRDFARETPPSGYFFVGRLWN